MTGPSVTRVAVTPVAVTPVAVTPLVVTPLPGMPEVEPGDDLAALVVAALARAGLDLRDGDVLVVSSKVLSKAQGLLLRQADPSAGGAALDRAAEVARQRQAAIEQESVRVVAERISPTGLTQVVETLSGPIMAAAGVDASNTGAADLLLLPRDPDEAATALRAAVLSRWTADDAASLPHVGVVISDTAGRPWRVGQTDFALGAAGVRLTEDLRGSVDAHGRALQVTERCLGDELASAADLVKGKAAGVPVAHVRGMPGVVADRTPGARSLVRTGVADWFALGSAEAVRAALGTSPGTERSRAAGIAATGPEPLPVRMARAVHVATAPLDGVRADVRDDRVVLSAPDAFGAGYAAARVEVALWGEGLAATVQSGEPAAGDSASDHAATAVVTLRPPTAPNATG